MLTLYQAEWCPYSSAVREILTELGVPFVAVPVEPYPEERDELRRLAGTDEIPVLQDEDGAFHRGTREIFAFLSRDAGGHAAAHRLQYANHREARVTDATARLLAHFPVD